MVWWKHQVSETPPEPSGANWFWYEAGDTSTMFRTMFQKPTDAFGIVGQFALNYFPGFVELSGTDLSDLMELCEDSKTPSNPEFDPGSVASLLAPNSIPENVHEELISEWVPGLSSTDASTPPSWPNQVAATAFMVSVNYCYAPFPTRVFYDWDIGSQNTTMFWNPNGAVPPQCAQNPEFFVTEPLLFGDIAISPNNTGYAIPENSATTPISCAQALPGLPRPDWMAYGDCEAKAIVSQESSLNPSNEPFKIVHCPITPPTADPAMAFWAWYFESGTPLTFMQTNATTHGTGLNLADYYQWLPGEIAPEGSYDIPAACDNQPKKHVNPACHKCHMPTNVTQRSSADRR